MSEFYEINPNLYVFNSSIRNLDISTDDVDENGMLIRNGTNRFLCHAISTDGDHVIFVRTNGNDGTLYDSNGESHTKCGNMEWIEAMGDKGQEPKERLEQGLERWDEAISKLLEEFEDNSDAIEKLSWYEEILIEIGSELNQS